jgi:hypothetical protein
MITKPRALPDEKIKEIKKLARKYTKKELAKMYFVDEGTIRNYLKLKL